MEKRWLANLLRNKKMVASFLKFLKVTEIKQKEKTKEREIKWAGKNNQANKDLLD